MNALLQAQQAYGSTKSATRTGRETEAQLLQGVVSQMTTAAANLPASFPHLAAAIHRNRQIWVHLATSVADADNTLPNDLKARLFYLARFVDQFSPQVLRGEAEIGPLVDVNVAVIRGLADGRDG